MELTCTATPECLRQIRHQVHRSLRGQLQSRVLDEVSLAIGEACANVVKHAYRGLEPGPLRLEVEVTQDEVRVTLWDRGHAVDLEHRKGRDLEDVRPGGLGMHFMECAFDPIEYRRDENGWNRLTLVRKLASD